MREIAAAWTFRIRLDMKHRRHRTQASSAPKHVHDMTNQQPLLTAEAIWRRYDEVESRLTAPVSERMLDLCDLRPGMRVFDIATGRGEPALGAARLVGPQGLVLGVDLSDALLQMAREKANREGLSNLDLRAGNAESTKDIPGDYFHAVTARWGLMYMAAPVAALANARRALLSGGILVAAFWAEPQRVPYFTLPRRLLERYRQLPIIDPEAPGIFRYAELGRIVRDLNQAGFVLEHVEEMETAVFEAATASELLAWVRAFGLTQLLQELPEKDRLAWEQEFIDAMELGRTGGLMSLGGVTRIVCARPM